MNKKNKYKWWILVYLFVLIMGINSFVTQYIAKAYSYHVALGLNFKHLYSPFAWVSWYTKFPDSYGVFTKALDFGTLLFVLLLGIPIYIAIKFEERLKGEADLHGTARFANYKDVKKSGLINDKAGMFLGIFEHGNKDIYLRHNGPEHVLLVAPTRTGKGVNNVNPTACLWQESIVFLDIKGEIYSMSSAYRKSMGQKIIRFEPTDASGTGAKYNPLGEVRINSPYAIKDAQFLAQMIVDAEGKGLKDYWDKAAFDFLAGIVLYVLVDVLQRENRPATLLDLSYSMTDKDRNIDELFEIMVSSSDFANFLSEKYPNSPYQEFFPHVENFINAAGRGMLQKADGEKSGVINTTLAFLAIYKDPVINLNTAENDFFIDDLLNYDVPVSLYLIIPPSDIDRVKPLIRFFVDILLRRPLEDFNAKRKHKLLCLFDEFPSVGKIKQIEYALSYSAGYGIYLMLICQDLQQIYSAYGKEETITGNCRIKVIFAPANAETAETFSKMLGKMTVISKKRSHSGKNNSVSINETARNLLNSDELSRLPLMQKNSKGEVIDGGAVIIFLSGKNPIYAKQLISFKHPIFKERFALGAATESDKLHSKSTDQAKQTKQTSGKSDYESIYNNLTSKSV